MPTKGALARYVSTRCFWLSGWLYRLSIRLHPGSIMRPEDWRAELERLRLYSPCVVPKVPHTEHYRLVAVYEPDESSNLWRFEITEPDCQTFTHGGLDKHSGYEFLWALERAFESGSILKGEHAA